MSLRGRRWHHADGAGVFSARCEFRGNAATFLIQSRTFRRCAPIRLPCGRAMNFFRGARFGEMFATLLFLFWLTAAKIWKWNNVKKIAGPRGVMVGKPKEKEGGGIKGFFF